MEVTLIDHMGDDLRVVNAARVSFAKEATTFGEKDERLLRYLATHDHWTPFAHGMVTLREKVPIFVARQRFKHTVGFTYNEVSRRYVDDQPEFFIPDRWRSRPDGSVKQGSIDVEPPEVWAKLYKGEDLKAVTDKLGYNDILELCETWYRKAIKLGYAPEQARMVLPQSMYTEYYTTGSLAAFARAYTLRSDPHAQQEIQELAKEWDCLIRPLFPVSWSALVDK